MRARFWWPLAVAVSVMVWLVPATARAQATRTVTGMVVDGAGDGVVGATVVLDGDPAVTTQSVDGGGFVLAKVPVGDVLLRLTAPGFDPVAVPLKAGKAAVTLSVSMTRQRVEPPPTRMLTGLVRDDAGAPVANATVRVQGTELAALTDGDGLFLLPGVTTADVVLEVSAPDHTGTTVTVAAGDGSVKVALASTATEPVAPPTPTVRRVHGTVVEASTGDPVPGATVQIEGGAADQLAITDENGAFVLEGVSPGPVNLQVAAVGYDDFTLAVDPSMDDVVITLGYGTNEEIYVEGRAPVIVKQNLANGASVVDDQELNRVSAQTLDGALAAKLPGANLQFNSGAPGGGAQLRLRGISTINGQSSPLFVIDGVIISNVAVPSGANSITAAAAGGSQSNQDNAVNRIADLNPNDIETVEVLKGASAAALYGSKAANGVVIITTKRGRGGKTQVHVTQRFGFSAVSNTLGSRTFGSAQEVMDAYGATSPLVDAYNASGGATFDHEGEITQTKLASETIASAAGGTEKASYYGSVLVKDEPGVVIGTFYQKQAGRLALGYRLWDRLKVGLTANIIHSKSDRGLTNNDNTGTSYYVVLSGTPSFVDLLPSGGVYPANPAVGSGSNPLQTVQLFQNREDVWRLIGGTNASLDLWSNAEHKVELLGNFGVDSFDQHNTLLSPPELIFEPIIDGLAGTSIDASTVNLNYNLGVGAQWGYEPASGAFRSALSGGLTLESVDLSSVYVTAQNLTAGQPNVDSGTSVSLLQSRLRTKDQGVYVQEEVALLDDKLSLLAGMLGERSSLNGDTGHYYLFPKFAAVYGLPVEKDLFDVLRVRGAYGEAGNRPNYGQKFTALNATNNIDGNAGLTVGGNAGDPDIQPERQREVELGVDAALEEQRAVIELTAYQRSISDLLLQRSLATSTGFTTQFFNGGSMRNRGLEAALTVVPVSGAFDWTARAIFTLNRSTITALPDGVDAFDITAAGFGAGLGAYRIEEGKSATQIVGSVDADGTIAPLGDGEPSFRMGIANDFHYKEWSLATLLDWQQGSKIINLTRLLYDFGQVTPDYVGAGEARLDAFSNGDIRPYIEDASFLKVREVSLTYDVPAKWAKQIGPVETLQVSLQGRNLLTFTGYSGLDPEVSNFGSQPIGRNYDVAPYPPSRSFWLSVSAGL